MCMTYEHGHSPVSSAPWFLTTCHLTPAQRCQSTAAKGNAHKGALKLTHCFHKFFAVMIRPPVRHECCL